MKSTIFCLLSFWAFQTVLTDELQEIEKLRQAALRRINNYPYGLMQEAMTRGKYAKQKGVSEQRIADCRSHISFDAWNHFTFLKFDSCENCYEGAVKSKSIEVAEECCIKEIEELEEQAKKDLEELEACVRREVAKVEGRGTKRMREEE